MIFAAKAEMGMGFNNGNMFRSGGLFRWDDLGGFGRVDDGYDPNHQQTEGESYRAASIDGNYGFGPFSVRDDGSFYASGAISLFNKSYNVADSAQNQAKPAGLVAIKVEVMDEIARNSVES